MIDRINLILKAKNISPRQFAEEIGIQPSGMSHILSGRNRPSLDFVMKVVTRYPEIDIRWLTLGEGEMYVAPSSMPRQADRTGASTLGGVDHYAAGGDGKSGTSTLGGVDHYAGAEPMGNDGKYEEPDLFSMAAQPTLFDVTPQSEVQQRAFVSSVQQGGQAVVQQSAPQVVQQAVQQGGQAVVQQSAPQAVQQADVVARQYPDVEIPQRGNAETETEPVLSKVSEQVLDSRDVVLSDRNEPQAEEEAPADENRLFDSTRPPAPEKRVLARKRVAKVIIFYDDHSFTEYYPE